MLASPSWRTGSGGAEAHFSVAVHPHRSQVIVAPSGELDLSTVEVAGRELDHLRGAGFEDVVVDLRAVGFCDSSGLRLLLEQRREALTAGVRFHLVDGTPAIRRLFEITGADTTFEFVQRPSS